jgi:TonB-linked SusC/RagA family outer membrane protein
MELAVKRRGGFFRTVLSVKNLRIMKMAVLLLFIATLQVSARTDAQQIDLKEQHASLKKVFREIERQSNYLFVYRNEWLKDARKVDVNLKDATIQQALDACLSGQSLTYSIINRNIIIRQAPPAPPSAAGIPDLAQTPVNGTVADSATGNPLVGVTIQVKGTTAGTTTDGQGKFSLEVPDGAVLIVSYLGYKSVEIPVDGQPTLHIRLAPSATGLNEVVVTALGLEQRQLELGYSTQEIKGNTLQTVKGIDVGTSLTGKVSGLMVKNSSEFMAEPEITLRGETPLLVVDGVPYGNVTLRDIPADDIESINFLKGATASALYGSRGGSGAIMVTTKKGAGAKGFTVSVNSSTMLEAGYLAIPKMQSKYGRVVNTATNTYVRSGDGSWGPPLDGREVIQWDPISKTMKAMPFLPRGKNNFKNFLQQGYILNNNVSVSQVGDKGGVRASATWVQNKGTYPNSRFDKVNYSVGGDIKLDRFSLSTTLSYSNQSSPNMGFNGYTGYDPMYSLLVWGSPDWNILDYKDYWLIPNEVQNSSYTAGNNNPYFDRYQRVHPVTKDIFSGQITLNYQFNDWLKAVARTGYDNYSNKQEVRVSEGSFQGGGATTVLDGGTEVWGESQRGSYNVGIGRGFSSNTDVMLMGDKKFRDFSVNGFIGGSVYYKQDEGIEALTKGGLSIPAFYSLKASVDPVYVNSLVFKDQVNSLYGKLGFGWRNLLFVEGTFRNDWASTLPEATRSYLYPSVSGSFIPSELLHAGNWLTFWKLRAAWTTYKTPAGIYDINNVYNIYTNQWGNLSSAAFPTSIRPSNIHAEGTASTEIGTDVSFLKDRVSADVTLYRKRMFDFIVKAPISPSSGFTSVYTNSNEERTRRGIEVSVNATPVKTKDFSWNIGLDWSKYATYFTRVDSQYSPNHNMDWVKVGKRVDYYTINEYQTDNKGDIVFNNGVPTYKPILSLAGYSDPDWIWGFNTQFRYKNLSLSLSMDGRVGGLAQSITEMYMWRSGNHPGSLTEARYLDATQPGTKNYLGKGVKVVSGSITYDANYHVVKDTRVFAPNDVYTTYKSYITALHKGTAWGGNPSPADLYSTTFLKLREVALTYRLPAAVAGKIRSKGIAVSLIGQNLFYWAKQFKYSDIDGGTENFADPSLRYVGIDLKLDF